MTFSIETISERLSSHLWKDAAEDGRAKAAVAMILRQGESGVELLYIRRALHEKDPWSGNIAFPGGKAMPGETLQQAAVRETAEEIGLDLTFSRYLGRLPEVVGQYLPVRVSCFVYWLELTNPVFELSDEVQGVFWADLDDIVSAEKRIYTTVNFGGEAFETPAISLMWSGAPVLWGLTYRLTCQFLEICEL
jgi:8-oxo-dGTP pyrophosphatase MutT (NUDIX family)